MTTYSEHDDVLTGGRWIQRGLIRVWQPDPVEPAPAPTPQRTPTGELIACPTCRATITQPCTSRTGRKVSPHIDRVVVTPRCPCGNALPKHREAAVKYCSDECRQITRAHQYRLYQDRKAGRVTVPPVYPRRAA